MSRRFPLQPLVDLSVDRVEAAERRLQALDAQRREAKDKLDQVEAYRVEYTQRLQQGLARGMGIEQLRDYQAFLARLDAACSQQATEVARRESAWLEGQQAWLEARRRRQAFEALAGRHQRAESAREGRLEQRLQDERAQAIVRTDGTRDPE